uniref:Coiled-coil and C2 domain-containing protein 1B n=1 Tax=Esox lucius TaxID=8010 RepID=A0A3P8XQG4_ESOLU
TEDNAMTDTSTCPGQGVGNLCCGGFHQVSRAPAAVPGSLQHTVEERLAMYRTAAALAKTSGESSKARRYDRGLKTLEAMLVSLKNGRKVDEADIPPPVATGAPPTAPMTSPTTHTAAKGNDRVNKNQLVCLCPCVPAVGGATKAMLCDRQREYKMAAIKAKQQGDLEQAKLYYRSSKKFDTAMEALETGHEVDLSSLPPPLSAGPASSAAPAPPSQPRDVLEALEQRRDRYQEACAQAKASGDERKARMHERIAKQYQSAIRAHKAGRPVNYEELPVPPGFPPIPGQEGAGAEQGFAVVLEAANKLATEEPVEPGDEDGENEEVTLQQLDFMEGRRSQYMKAALQAKQKNDLDTARTMLRTAKGLETLIEAAKAGKHVDISKVPSPPGDEDEDFILVHHSDVQVSERGEQVYSQLAKILKEQYEKCMNFSKQFTHLGNITETTKFEKMAESCKKSLEILKLSQSKGLEPPKHHFEERTYHTVRIFPDLSSTEMVVVIVKGMNLPAPSGVATNDLDAYVKFDFPYPSTEQAQKHRTQVIKNSNSPEFNQNFTLSINRNHRGFRRLIQSKGIKLELLHKGGFLRSDKPIGTAQIKLEKLEKESEVREIVEVMDGRKPTGGRVEVRVRLREPLSGQDLQNTTEPNIRAGFNPRRTAPPFYF